MLAPIERKLAFTPPLRLSTTPVSGKSSPTSILNNPPLTPNATNSLEHRGNFLEQRGEEKISKHNNLPSSAARSPSPSPDTTLGDINFLHQFKQKMVDNQTQKKVGGRYSLIDRWLINLLL